MRGKAGPACQGLKWQEGGGPYPCASRTPRMTLSGTETSPRASADTAPGGTRPGLGRCRRRLGRAAAGCLGRPASSLSPRVWSDLQAPELLFGPASLYLGRRAVDTHSPGQLTLEPPGLWPSSRYLLAVRGAGGLRWPRSQGRPEGGLLRPLPGQGSLLWVLVAIAEVPGHPSGSLLADVLLPAGLLLGGEQILHGSVGEGPGRKGTFCSLCLHRPVPRLQGYLQPMRAELLRPCWQGGAGLLGELGGHLQAVVQTGPKATPTRAAWQGATFSPKGTRVGAFALHTQRIPSGT